jgi:hypothetical protein
MPTSYLAGVPHRLQNVVDQRTKSGQKGRASPALSNGIHLNLKRSDSESYLFSIAL